MNIEGQLKLLLKQGEGKTYYSFANADGKRWWMPARHMAVGMNLYQPSGTKGKLLKRGLPWLHWNPVVRKVLHAERMQLALGDELRELLERIFGQQGGATGADLRTAGTGVCHLWWNAKCKAKNHYSDI